METGNSFFPKSKRRSLQDENDSYFDQLFRRHYPALTFICRKIISDDRIARSLVLEAFVITWSKAPGSQTEAELQSFLYDTTWKACQKIMEKGKPCKVSFNNPEQIYHRDLFLAQIEMYKRMPVDLLSRRRILPPLR